jgi:hypothetical protein
MTSVRGDQWVSFWIEESICCIVLHRFPLCVLMSVLLCVQRLSVGYFVLLLSFWLFSGHCAHFPLLLFDALV